MISLIRSHLLILLSSIILLCWAITPALSQETDTTNPDDPSGEVIDDDDGRDDDDESCLVEVVDAPEQLIISYDPFVPGATVNQLKFTINNSLNRTCEFKLQVSPPQEAPELEYEFTDTGVKFEVRPAQDQNIVSTTPVAGVYTALIPEDGSTVLIFETIIIKDSVAAASDHMVPIEFKLSSQGLEATGEETWITDVILRSMPRAQVNLSGTSGSFGEVGSMTVVDFGIAKKDAVRKLFVQLRSNTHSKLTIDSENKGVLKHKDYPKEAPPIPYTAKLDGEVVDLTKQFEAEYDLPKTYAGQSIPLELKLGEVKGAMAGKYADIIVFEFSPL